VIIVDTTVWIDYIGGRETPHTAWLDAAIPVTRLGLTDLILCEILQGVRGEAQARRLRFEMARFEVFTTGGTELAVAAAANYRALRSRGATVRKTIDCLIATFCILDGHSLLHCDRDYDPFEKSLGLQVVHP
jgi:predicted nucleic acid-binding protein